jgi:hypothetical protein
MTRKEKNHPGITDAKEVNKKKNRLGTYAAKGLDKQEEKNHLGTNTAKELDKQAERTAGFHKRYDRAIAIEPGMRPPKAKQRKMECFMQARKQG